MGVGTGGLGRSASGTGFLRSWVDRGFAVLAVVMRGRWKHRGAENTEQAAERFSVHPVPWCFVLPESCPASDALENLARMVMVGLESVSS